MNDEDEQPKEEEDQPHSTREERLKRLLKSRTKKARKQIDLIGNLTSANYGCPNQKEYLLKAIRAIESDLGKLKELVETGENKSRFDIDL